MTLINNPWILLALPLFSFVIVGLLIRPWSPKIAAIVATSSVFGAFLCAIYLAWSYFSGAIVSENLWHFEWLRFQPGLNVHFGFLIDPIAAMMLVVVTTVSLLVHIYSLGYMHDDPGYGRFFTYLNLFTFSMLGLVVAPNIFQMYVFWELVGVSSFLLIGFYYQKPSAVAASKKAFIVTRFADLGFLIGIFILGYLGLQAQQQLVSIDSAFSSVQALDFSFLTNQTVLSEISKTGFLGIALVLIYMGAAGKSAMFPLHIWLPDAMEGPTPVSALIHAATMVVAGVYLVARMFPAFLAAPSALELVAWVGLFTSAFAAIIACTQDDIKRVLAFSTLSQLGYMMFSLGVASFEHPLGYTASMFHLFTHAFFKALLFLGAGTVIHAVHTNNVWKMGGLRQKMPVTHFTFLIAVLAIAGVWPFAGFFSKDEILAATLESQHYFHFIGGLVVAALTSFYMARIYFLTFWGNGRSHSVDHAHEAPKIMLFPLLILAAMSICAGWIPFADYVSLRAVDGGHALSSEHHGMNPVVVFAGSFVAIAGLLLSWILYAQKDFHRVEAWTSRFFITYGIIKRKFYFDEIYFFITHQVIFRFVAAPISWFDRTIVDGTVNFIGDMTQKSSALMTLIQTGQLQTYGVWFVLGTVTTLIFLWMMVH